MKIMLKNSVIHIISKNLRSFVADFSKPEMWCAFWDHLFEVELQS